MFSVDPTPSAVPSAPVSFDWPASLTVVSTQLPCPLALVLRFRCGALARMDLILTSPFIKSGAEIPIDRVSAVNIGWSRAQSAFDRLTPWALTPITGQTDSATSPLTASLRPVCASNWSETSSASLSPGSNNSPPITTTMVITKATNIRNNNRMVKSLSVWT